MAVASQFLKRVAPICPIKVGTHVHPQMSGNVINRVRLGLRRVGGEVVHYDDGCGGGDRTAHRRPRSDKGFEEAHDEGTSL